MVIVSIEKLRYILLALGIYLNIDGWYSIYRYWNTPSPDGGKQNWKDHIVRVIRAGVGITLIILSLIS
jgi:hypothetical protein